MNNNLKPHLAIFGANLIYGINYTVAKGVMPEFILPFGFIFCRVLGALILFAIVGLFIKEKVEKKDLGRLAICGLFGVCANQLMFFYGLNITTPINAGIIMTSNPILVLLASAFILKSRITWLKIAGITLGIIGALMILLFKEGFAFGSETIVGDIFIFLNALSYGVYLVLAKPLMNKYQPLTVIKWVFAFGFLFAAPFGFNEFKAIEWNSFTPNIWWSFIFVIVGTTFLAYLFNIYGLKKLNPSAVATYIYMQPVLAALFAIWVGKDTFTWIKLIAALFIFMGVYLVSKPSTVKN